MKPPQKIKETDLFLPVKEIFENLDYSIRSEVKDCDVTALKGEDLIIVELKLRISLKLLTQATARQKYTEMVYIAIPRPASPNSEYRANLRLLKRLQLGLITVSFLRNQPTARVEFDPPQQPVIVKRRKTRARRGLLAEIRGRSQDLNVGGSNGKSLVTAYRESAIYIAVCLKLHGAQTTAQLRDLGGGTKTLSILADNHYGWFRRVIRGTYEVTEQGLADLILYPEITDLHLEALRTQSVI
jgi:hypothetical protein